MMIVGCLLYKKGGPSGTMEKQKFFDVEAYKTGNLRDIIGWPVWGS